jgi:hypothetical protein
MNTYHVSSDSAEKSKLKLIDFYYLNEFADGDADFIKKMVPYLYKFPIALKILEANEVDDNNLKSEVHKLKSLSIC